MQPERRVRLFRNGRSQAVRILREFELQGTEVVRAALRLCWPQWKPLDDDFPETEDAPEDLF